VAGSLAAWSLKIALTERTGRIPPSLPYCLLFVDASHFTLGRKPALLAHNWQDARLGDRLPKTPHQTFLGLSWP